MEKEETIARFVGLITDYYLKKTTAVQILDISRPTLERRLKDGGWRPGEIALMNIFISETFTK